MATFNDFILQNVLSTLQGRGGEGPSASQFLTNRARQIQDLQRQGGIGAALAELEASLRGIAQTQQQQQQVALQPFNLISMLFGLPSTQLDFGEGSTREGGGFSLGLETLASLAFPQGFQ